MAAGSLVDDPTVLTVNRIFGDFSSVLRSPSAFARVRLGSPRHSMRLTPAKCVRESPQRCDWKVSRLHVRVPPFRARLGVGIRGTLSRPRSFSSEHTRLRSSSGHTFVSAGMHHAIEETSVISAPPLSPLPSAFAAHTTLRWNVPAGVSASSLVPPGA